MTDEQHATPTADNVTAFYDLLHQELPGLAMSALVSQLQARRVPQSALSLDAALAIAAAYAAGRPADEWIDAAGLPGRRIASPRPGTSDGPIIPIR